MPQQPNVPQASEFTWWHIVVNHPDGSYKTHEDLLTEEKRSQAEAQKEAARLLHVHSGCSVNAIKYQVLHMGVTFSYSPGDV